MNIPLVDLKVQYNSIKKEVNEKISEVLSSTQYILGDEVSFFEEEFSNYCGASFGIGVGSGTEALYLSLLANDIGAGDEVITVANTFIATVLAISYTGARPVLVDINPGSFNINVNQIEKAITKKTKAIIPVHLYGLPVNMDPIIDLAKKYGLFIVEDACQAHGAEYKTKKVGSFGNVSCFSFYPGKNLGAYGDGGIIVTSDEKVADKLKMFRNYGSKIKYHHDFKGVNSRLDTLQAAILRIKLKKLDQWNELRKEAAKKYDKYLNGTGIMLPENNDFSKHVYHLYVVRAKRRNELLEFLKDKGVGAGIHYPIPIHFLKAYRDLEYGKGSFLVTEQYANEILSLPIFPEISDEQIQYVASCIKDFTK